MSNPTIVKKERGDSLFRRHSLNKVLKAGAKAFGSFTDTIFPNTPDVRHYHFKKYPRNVSKKYTTPDEGHNIKRVSHNFPKDGVKLSTFDNFMMSFGGTDNFRGLTTAQVNQKFVLPTTSYMQSSYCDYLKSKENCFDVGTAQVFISHAWKYQFLDVVEALKSHFRDNKDIFIWFDLFSNNQHKDSTSQSFEWWSETFKSAIAQFGHTVLILAPWNDPIPLRR
jgi:hypothetical protein